MKWEQTYPHPATHVGTSGQLRRAVVTGHRGQWYVKHERHTAAAADSGFDLGELTPATSVSAGPFPTLAAAKAWAEAQR